MGKLGRLLAFRLYGSWTVSFLLGIAGCLCAVPRALLFAEPSAGQTATLPQSPALPSETPTQFQPVTDSFDYVRHDVMIPMRDGVKLHTVIVIPKGAKNAPILLTRTPYSASAQVMHTATSMLDTLIQTIQ